MIKLAGSIWNIKFLWDVSPSGTSRLRLIFLRPTEVEAVAFGIILNLVCFGNFENWKHLLGSYRGPTSQLRQTHGRMNVGIFFHSQGIF